ncbi:hypothetical protein Sste5346_002101 [Sporothrix stenoceras]|uniref:Non-homologous end-joining factor 1 n=1 Tax=Sporothrix stenoceras TaxID=5173 RepID=A0ABR3ZLX8_9PEZI
MDDGREWRLLPATHPDVPVLLVATSFGPAAYSVYVTDLAHVWAERLERRDICMRAFQENTTIDPSYDSEQMGVFLGKLQAALEGDADARLSIAMSPKQEGDLVLHTTSALPAGLQPLKWPIYLKKQSATAIASNLVVPLIQNRAAHQRAEARLVAALQDKDAVINKLADKLEAMGAGVESAFPTLVGGGRGSRKISRRDMEARVRGLARFDETNFRKQMEKEAKKNGADEDDDANKTTNLVEEAFGSGSGLQFDDAAVGTSSQPSSTLENWWQELGTGLGVPMNRTGPAKGSNSQQPANSNDDTMDVDQLPDDGFQEATPKKTKAPRKEIEEAKPVVEEPPSPTPAKPKAGLGKIGRLGAIGKKPKASSPPPPSPPPAEKDDSGDETASDGDDLEPPKTRAAEKEEAKKAAATESDDDKEPTPTVTTASLRTKPAKKGLGRIGGKKKAPTPEPEPGLEPELQQEPEAEAAPEEEPEPKAADSPPPKPAPAKAKGGLGRIGKGKPSAVKKEPTDDGSDEEDTGKRKAAQEEEEAKPAAAPPPPPKEDAKKKAEVLQKAVEKHAAPVRKKRKF